MKSKRFFTLLLALCFLPLLAVPAWADILWEPSNDSFYDRHRNDCVSDQRHYYANGKEGFVTVWDRPGGSRVIQQYPNGETLYIAFLYPQDNWGMNVLWDDSTEVVGWVDMEDLSLIYDHISFEEEYAGQIRPYNGEFAQYAGEDDHFGFFEYPGAPSRCQIFELDNPEQRQDFVNRLTGSDGENSYIQSVFVDEDGRTWGYVGYLFGHLDAWFCLDDPDGADFPVRQVNQPPLIPAQTPVMPNLPQSRLAYYLAGGVVAVTVVLLAVFYRKKKGASR